MLGDFSSYVNHLFYQTVIASSFGIYNLADLLNFANILTVGKSGLLLSLVVGERMDWSTGSTGDDAGNILDLSPSLGCFQTLKVNMEVAQSCLTLCDPITI